MQTTISWKGAEYFYPKRKNAAKARWEDYGHLLNFKGKEKRSEKDRLNHQK